VSTRSSEDGRFSYLERVRFGDLDAMQHLNNVEFLRYFETARIAFVEQVLPGRSPGDVDGFGFIFAECHIAYRSPARYGEEIRTFVWPQELERSSVRLGFEMRAEGDGRLVADGWGTLVGYDYAAGGARPIPDPVREALEAGR
jgi:acyl-CoA thioester hydrolase